MKRLVMGLCLLMPCALQASMLKGIYESFSKNSNYTPTQSFQDQQAGYWTGGGLVVRNKTVSVDPFQISMPRIRAGCGGIDAFLGGLSFVKGEKIKQLLQALPSMAASYGVQLAMQTLSPEVANELKDLMQQVQKMSSDLLNSCHMSMNLVGGLLPKGSKAEELHCKNLEMAGGEDSFGARENCQDLNTRIERVEEMKSDPDNEDILQGEYNLTWHIAQKLNFDEETSLFALSALGTIVSKKEDGRFRVTYHRGFGSEKDFLEGHLVGGQRVDAYICLDRACSDVQKKSVMITPQKALLHYFARWFDKMREDYLQNRMSSHEAEQTIALLIDASSLPLMRFIEISASTGARGLINEALEYMSRQILINRIERLSVEVKTAASAMAKVQLEDGVIEAFKSQIDRITESLKSQGAAARRDTLLRLEQVLEANERVVKATKGI